jgi:hypothetical protein
VPRLQHAHCHNLCALSPSPTILALLPWCHTAADSLLHPADYGRSERVLEQRSPLPHHYWSQSDFSYKISQLQLPRLHAHSLTTRLLVRGSTVTSSSQAVLLVGPHIRFSQSPRCNLALSRIPLLCSPTRPATSNRTAASLTAAARKPAAFFKSVTLTLAVRRANRPHFRVRLRPATCTR